MTPLQANAYLALLLESGIKADLDQTRLLAERMGNPQEAYPCILVAGTNGKGSVASALASILSAAGFVPGLYTSPHLVTLRERIRVGRRLISREELARSLTRVRAAGEEAADRGWIDGTPTYFEALTLGAFDHFRRERVSMAVLEVGLGGRWDCTNIVRPILCLTSSIGIDHEEWLGKGIRNIAREKAGIFRPLVPAVSGTQQEEVLEVLRSEALKAGTALREPDSCVVEHGGCGFEVRTPEGRAVVSEPPLRGAHQVGNLALACRAALCLRTLGWDIPEEAFRTGIKSLRWPGRLHRIPGPPDLIFDGAHNEDACRSLAAFAGETSRPRVLVMAAMEDKPIREMVTALLPAFDSLVATQVPMERCLAAERLSELAPTASPAVIPDPEEALAVARERAGETGTVTVAGSLYLVGYLMERLGFDPDAYFEGGSGFPEGAVSVDPPPPRPTGSV